MKFFQPAQATEWRPVVAHGETVGFNSKMNKAPAGAKEEIRGLFFCRPVRGWKSFFVNEPTVSPWATFWHASGAVAALVLFLAVGARAETTNALSGAEIQGRQLAQQLCDARPAENHTNDGTILIRWKTNQTLGLHIETSAGDNEWQTHYIAYQQSGPISEELKVVHSGFSKNRYLWRRWFAGGMLPPFQESTFPNSAAFTNSFFNTDFSFADLGLEFFHWPAQKVLPKTPKMPSLKLGREYTLLESTNPNPATNGYSRVLTWIDRESGGILQAEAYDAAGKLLKVFEPKSYGKVNGQWQLHEIQIRNVQTGSRTRLEFDLTK
jgi:hypothetical protein